MNKLIDLAFKTLTVGFCVFVAFLSCSSKDEGRKLDPLDNELISSRYPNDLGIEKDPDVLFVEKFEDGLPDVLKRYSNVKNGAHMQLLADVPQGNVSGKSVSISNNNGATDGGHLYKKFDPGFDGEVYLRYYVKYPEVSRSKFSHISVRIGGYDPASDYPIGRAGICNLATNFNLSYEPVTDNGKMETYLYWPTMHASNAQGDLCYGNHMITNSGKSKNLVFGKWMCVELMIKMNTPGRSDGEFRVWQDGEEMGYWKPGAPKGKWQGGIFNHSSDGTPFEGFMWRGAENPNLKINNIKFEFYDTKSPKGYNNYVQYSNVVIAKKRIGPLRQ
jgi:hypothetical protein